MLTKHARKLFHALMTVLESALKPTSARNNVRIACWEIIRMIRGSCATSILPDDGIFLELGEAAERMLLELQESAQFMFGPVLYNFQRNHFVQVDRKQHDSTSLRLLELMAGSLDVPTVEVAFADYISLQSKKNQLEKIGTLLSAIDR